MKLGVFKQMPLKSHSILSKPIDDKAWRQLSTSQKFGLKIELKFGLLEMGSKPTPAGVAKNPMKQFRRLFKCIPHCTNHRR
jgi:hypothetical protein